ncbi:MAG TPA: hypothetical protein VGE72_24605 [Azospirillum sp.]
MREPDAGTASTTEEPLEVLAAQFRTLAGLHAVRRRFGVAGKGGGGKGGTGVEPAELVRLIGDALSPTVSDRLAGIADRHRAHLDALDAREGEALRRVGAVVDRIEAMLERERRSLPVNPPAGETVARPAARPVLTWIAAWTASAAAAFVAGLALAPQLRDPLMVLLAHAGG